MATKTSSLGIITSYEGDMCPGRLLGIWSEYHISSQATTYGLISLRRGIHPGFCGVQACQKYTKITQDILIVKTYSFFCYSNITEYPVFPLPNLAILTGLCHYPHHFLHTKTGTREAQSNVASLGSDNEGSLPESD